MANVYIKKKNKLVYCNNTTTSFENNSNFKLILIRSFIAYFCDPKQIKHKNIYSLSCQTNRNIWCNNIHKMR